MINSSAIHITQKTDFDIEITVKSKQGIVKDLTGSTARFIIAKDVNSSPLVTLTSPGGIELTDLPNGVLTVKLSQDDTNRRGDYYYECEVTSPLGDRSIASSGTLTFQKTNTRY